MATYARAHTMPTALDAAASARQLRRLDWRFLLPDPQLARVGYIGPGNSTLARALDAHAESLAYPLRERPNRPALDLLVAESVGADAVARASQCLVPGGWLYWELGPPHFWRSRDPNRIAAHGVRQVAVHWHYRGFNECRWVIALDQPGSVATVLSRRFADSSPALVSGLARLIAKSHALRRVLATSVIAQRSLP